MKRVTQVVLVIAFASGCLTDNRASRDRGAAGLFENVPLVSAPPVGRCEKLPAGGFAQKNCEEAKYLADIYVRKLSTSDEVCLEGGFGEVATAACLARASVVDSAPNKILIEVRESKPDSKWFKREQHHFWFEEGALVDLYLADHGY